MKTVGDYGSDYLTSLSTALFSPFLWVVVTRRVMACLFSMNSDTAVCWRLTVLVSGHAVIPQLHIQSAISRKIRSHKSNCISTPCVLQCAVALPQCGSEGLDHLPTVPPYLSWPSYLREKKLCTNSKCFFSRIRKVRIFTCSLQTLHKMITCADYISVQSFLPT
jgi:hypothetical protein